MNKSVGKIVREYFLDATHEYVEFILWTFTSFPEFWHIPEDGNTPEECLRTQLKEYQEMVYGVKNS